MSTTPTTPPASPVDPNAAGPRMIIWTTLRCLELQIDQHEELHNSHGVVSWELIKHMLRLAKRHAHEEGGKAEAAEQETDEWRTRADEANARIRQLESELQAALGEAAHAEIVALRKQRDEATRDCIRLNAEQVWQFVHLQAANADAVALRRCLGQIREQLAQMDDPQQTDLSLLLKIRSAVAEFDARDRPQPPTESPPAVTEPLDDSSSADGPGQS